MERAGWLIGKDTSMQPRWAQWAVPDLACWRAAQAEFEGVRREMEKEAVRAAKLEQRLGVLTKGYTAREAALRADIAAAWDAAQAAEQARSTSA